MFGAGRRCGSNLALLWLWHRPATTALIPSLEPPYALGVPPKSQKKKKKKKKKKERERKKKGKKKKRKKS